MEFMPGVTGTRDVLSALEEPGQFAIVPRLNIEHAPFDPRESGRVDLGGGRQRALVGEHGGATVRATMYCCRHAMRCWKAPI